MPAIAQQDDHVFDTRNWICYPELVFYYSSHEKDVKVAGIRPSR